MKKIIISMLLLFTGVALFGQTDVVNSLGTKKNVYTYNGKVTDTIGSGDSVLTINIFKETFAKMNCHATIDADSLGGTADSVLFTLKGKGNETDSFESVTTKKWYGSSDTVFYIETSSSKQYRFWQIDMTGYSDSFQAKLSLIEFLFLTD